MSWYDKALDGDYTALAKEYEKHRTGLSVFLYSKGVPRDHAQDVIQDCYIKFQRAVANGIYDHKSDSHLRAFLKTVCYNTYMDGIRKDKRMPSDSIEKPIGDEDGATLSDMIAWTADDKTILGLDPEEYYSILGLYKYLSDEQRCVFEDRLMGIPFKYITVRRKIGSINTALGRFRYAARNIRDMIEAGKRNNRFKEEHVNRLMDEGKAVMEKIKAGEIVVLGVQDLASEEEEPRSVVKTDVADKASKERYGGSERVERRSGIYAYKYGDKEAFCTGDCQKYLPVDDFYKDLKYKKPFAKCKKCHNSRYGGGGKTEVRPLSVKEPTYNKPDAVIKVDAAVAILVLEKTKLLAQVASIDYSLKLLGHEVADPVS